MKITSVILLLFVSTSTLFGQTNEEEIYLRNKVKSVTTGNFIQHFTKEGRLSLAYTLEFTTDTMKCFYSKVGNKTFTTILEINYLNEEDGTVRIDTITLIREDSLGVLLSTTYVQKDYTKQDAITKTVYKPNKKHADTVITLDNSHTSGHSINQTHTLTDSLTIKRVVLTKKNEKGNIVREIDSRGLHSSWGRSIKTYKYNKDDLLIETIDSLGHLGGSLRNPYTTQIITKYKYANGLIVETTVEKFHDNEIVSRKDDIYERNKNGLITRVNYISYTTPSPRKKRDWWEPEEPEYKYHSSGLIEDSNGWLDYKYTYYD